MGGSFWRGDKTRRNRRRVPDCLFRGSQEGGHIKLSWVNHMRARVTNTFTDTAIILTPLDGGHDSSHNDVMVGVLTQCVLPMEAKISAKGTKLGTRQARKGDRRCGRSGQVEGGAWSVPKTNSGSSGQRRSCLTMQGVPQIDLLKVKPMVLRCTLAATKVALLEAGHGRGNPVQNVIMGQRLVNVHRELGGHCADVGVGQVEKLTYNIRRRLFIKRRTKAEPDDFSSDRSIKRWWAILHHQGVRGSLRGKV
jgi:hypothetical protein